MSAAARVLIVEDQHVEALDCQAELVRAGYTCVGIANTAAEALMLARRERPDLVLMDIRLASRTDGIETAREIYDQFGIRALFVTAHNGEKPRALETPYAVGWLSKPYSPQELVAAVGAAMDRLVAARDA